MKYETILRINKKDKKHYLDLLSDINSGCKDDFIQIASSTFENGFTIYVDLCSGSSNYFLQYELVDAKNNVVVNDVLDVDFEDFNIEDNKDIYTVRFMEV